MDSSNTSLAKQRKSRRQRNGSQLALLILGLNVAIGLTPASELAAYLYPALTVATTANLLARGRVDYALELNLWTWATAPGLRRLIDWSSGSLDESNPILVTASLSAMLFAGVVLRADRRAPVGFGYAFFVILGAALFATVIGLRNNGPLPAAISALLSVAPVMVGLTLLTAGDDLKNRIQALLRFSRWALLLLSTYAIAQWAIAPAWDSFWLDVAVPYSAEKGSPFGRPEPFAIRPFGLFNSPFGFAHLMVWLLISQIGTVQRGHLLAITGISLGCFALALTGIRAAWVTAALTLAVLALYRQVRLTRLLVLLAVTTALAAAAAPLAAEAISRRIGTASAAESDVSVLARMQRYSEALPHFLADPFGAGMGSTGSGARAAAQSNLGFNFSLDSSYLEVLRVNGSILGTCTIIAALVMSVAAFQRSKGKRPPLPAWGAMSLVVPIDMLLGSILYGPQAVVTWIILGACGAATSETQEGRRGRSTSSPEAISDEPAHLGP